VSDDLRKGLRDLGERARPDDGAFERLRARRRRVQTRRRASAIVLVAALAAAGTVVFVRLGGREGTPAARPDHTVLLRGGQVTFVVPGTWDVDAGEGTLRFYRDLPGGGTIEVFAWDLRDERVRPIDPLTGEAGPPGAPTSWYERFTDREADLRPYRDRGPGYVSYWTTGKAQPLLWLLSFGGVDVGSVERADYRIDGHFAPRTAFELGAAATVLQTPAGAVTLDQGRVWAWYSPISDLRIVLGYATSPGADPAEASRYASEIFRQVSLPAPT
jgi:hypothetical protein